MFRIIKKSLKIGVVTGQYRRAEKPALPVSPEAKDKPNLQTVARDP